MERVKGSCLLKHARARKPKLWLALLPLGQTSELLAMTVHGTGEGQLSVETRESEETEALAGTLAAWADV